MSEKISVDSIDPGLASSLRELGAHDVTLEDLHFSEHLLLMYPEGAFDIVNAMGPSLGKLGKLAGDLGIQSNAPPLCQFWGQLLMTLATTEILKEKLAEAQQRFLLGVYRGGGNPLIDSFLGIVGSGPLAAQNFKAIHDFAHGLGSKWNSC